MASPFDLISLSDLKSWLGVSGTEDDTLLAQLITQISRTTLSFIDRATILPRLYTETYDGRNDVSLMLRQWPVTGVLSCLVDGLRIPAAPPLTVAAPAQAGYVLDTSAIEPPGSMQRLSLRGFLYTCGIQNVTVSYSAGYQIANENAVVPMSPPYSVSALGPYGNWASDVSVAYTNGQLLQSAQEVLAAGQYSAANGTYTFSAADAGAAILLTYGYIPSDLASCCMEWTAERYAYRSRIGQQSKSLGGQETMAFIVKDIPGFVEAALSPYRRVIMP